MKKLAIAVAMVCAASITQAATITWSATKINCIDKGLVSGTAAYLFSASQADADAIITGLEGVGASAANTWLASIANKIEQTSADGKVLDTSTKPNATKAGLVADGTQQTLMLLVFNTSKVTDDSMFHIASKTASVPSGDSNQVFGFGTQEANSMKSDNWHAVSAVPEPTSGLLLLLGVAGLALRRRRA